MRLFKGCTKTYFIFDFFFKSHFSFFAPNHKLILKKIKKHGGGACSAPDSGALYLLRERERERERWCPLRDEQLAAIYTRTRCVAKYVAAYGNDARR